MPVFIAAVITGVAAAVIGREAHSSTVGFVAFVVISLAVIGFAAGRRRQSAEA